MGFASCPMYTVFLALHLATCCVIVAYDSVKYTTYCTDAASEPAKAQLTQWPKEMRTA